MKTVQQGSARFLTLTADKYVNMLTPADWLIILIPPAYPPLISLLHRSLRLCPQIRSSRGSMITLAVIKGKVGKQSVDGKKSGLSWCILTL